MEGKEIKKPQSVPPPPPPGKMHLVSLSAQQPSPPAPPAALKPAAGVQAGTGELEKTVKALQAELQALKAAAGAPKAGAGTEKELETLNKKIEALGVTVKGLDSSSVQERITASAGKIAGLEASFSDMSKALFALKKDLQDLSAEYGDNFLALKNGLKALKTDSEYMESALEKLKEKAAGLEKMFGPGLEELRDKFAAREKTEKRAFKEFGAELEKAFQDQFGDMLGQLKTVREKIDVVSKDYKLVIDKRMLALEAKYSAFETISRRLDSIAEQLKKR